MKSINKVRIHRGNWNSTTNTHGYADINRREKSHYPLPATNFEEWCKEQLYKVGHRCTVQNPILLLGTQRFTVTGTWDSSIKWVRWNRQGFWQTLVLAPASHRGKYTRIHWTGRQLLHPHSPSRKPGGTHAVCNLSCSRSRTVCMTGPGIWQWAHTSRGACPPWAQSLVSQGHM